MSDPGLIYIAGHSGLAGSALRRAFIARGAGERLLLRSHAELELTDGAQVSAFFRQHRPQVVILAAARVGGIAANSSRPADFIRDNLLIQTNVIDAAWRNGSRKLLFLGSSCIYPRLAPQPIREEYLLTGPLEPTNDAYAIAKIAGIKTCQAYRRQHGFDAVSVMPSNLYGPHDNFSPEDSHVLAALLARFHAARVAGASSVTVWGSGEPRREFLHVDDFASACLTVLDHYSDELPLNVGLGEDVSIRELALLIAQVTGFEGRIEWDATRPDGTPRKLLDITRLRALGWAPGRTLREGLESVYRWYTGFVETGKPAAADRLRAPAPMSSNPP